MMEMYSLYCKQSPIPYPEVGLENGVYGKYVEKDGILEFQPCDGKIELCGSRADFETGEEKIYIKLTVGTKKIEVVLDELNEETVEGLGEFGLFVDAPILLKVLQNEKAWKNKGIYYHSLGYQHNSGCEPIFKGANIMGLDGRYFGDYVVYPKGIREEWCDMLKNEIVHCTPLFFILCAATAGVVSDYLLEECLKIHLVEEVHDNGAWLAGLLGVSCGSDPDPREHSLVFNNVGAFTAKEETLPNSFPCLVRGVPTVRGKYKRYDFLRADAEKTGNWYEKHHTTIFSVSEKMNKTSTEKASDVPWIEIGDIKWFKDKTQAKRIRKFISENYALWMPWCAGAISGWGKIKLEYHVTKALREFKELAKVKGIFSNAPEEVFKQIAMIIASAEILKDEFHLDMTNDNLLEFIVQNATITWQEVTDNEL